MKRFLSSAALALVTGAALSAAPGRTYAVKTGTPSAQQPLEVMRLSEDVREAGRKFQGLKVRDAATGNLTARSFTGHTAKADRAWHAPMLREPGNIDLRGSVNWSQDQLTPVGLYRLPTDSPELELIGAGIKATYGGAQIGDRYYAINGLIWGSLYFFDGYVYDTETWGQIDHTDQIPLNIIGQCTGVDPTDGTVYGCFYDENGENLEFGTVDYSTWSRTSTIATIDMNNSWSAVAFNAAGQMYVVKLDGSLYSADKTTGECTLIGSTGLHPVNIGGGVIDPASGRFFFSCDDNSVSALYEINLETAEATKLYNFENSAQVCCPYIPLPEAAAAAPAAVTDLAAVFADGSLSGEINFKAPTTLYDGTAAEGDLTYQITANGEQLASGATTFGSEVSAAVTVAAPGSYKFVVTVANAEGTSPKATTSVYVGDDTPVMTQVSLSKVGSTLVVSWDKVTESVNGGYFDADAVTYTVTAFPSGEVVAENITENSFSQEIETPESYTVYSYEVTARFGNAVSAPVRSNYLALGAIVPPFTDDFTSFEALSGYTVWDNNSDGNTWYYDNGRLCYRYSSVYQGDDWFVTPAIRLEGGKMYKVTVGASAQGWWERMEIKWGRTNNPESFTETIVEPFYLAHYEEQPYGGYIVTEEAGDYYVGMHAISDPDSYFLYLNSFSISEGQSTLCPAAIADLKAVPAYDGGNSATVTLTAPSLTYSGAELTQISRVVLKRNGQEIHVFESPAPGAELSYTDTVEESGVYTYTAESVNDEGTSLPAEVQTRIGIPLPTAPLNVNLAAGEGGIASITWDAPETDTYGNPLNPALVTYSVYDCVGETYVAQGLTETSYEYEAVTEGQKFLYYAVYAVTGAGNAYALTELQPIGTPYALPYAETFAGAAAQYAMAVVDQNDGGTWSISNDSYFVDIMSVTGDGGFAFMKGDYISSSAALLTGKISLAGADRPGIGMYVFNFGDANTNELKICVMAEGGEWTEVTALTMEELPYQGWNYVMADLEAYKDKVIELKFIGTTCKYTYIILDDITVRNLPEHDLGVSELAAPSSVEPGTEFEVNVRVSNYGMAEASDFDVVFYHNGKETARLAGDPLASGASAVYTCVQNLNPAAPAVSEYYAEVVMAGDEVADNNVSDVATTLLVQPSWPAPTALNGEVDGHVATLTWLEPDFDLIPTEPYTETFEEGESGSDTFGEWLFVDVDQSPIGGIQNNTLPGHIQGETLSSFWIFDNEDGDYNLTFDAHSGHKYLMSIYRNDGGQVSDWAISPELYGGAQTISFFAKSYNPTYPEKIEVRCSLNGTDIDDFSQVVMPETTLGGDWTEFRVDLPAGARYFAIHSCATDAFILMVDDVTFCPKNGTKVDMSLMGYNIYRDGVKLNALPVEETEYVDVELPETATYVVTAVYTNGESAPSEGVTLHAVTGVDLTAAQSAAIMTEGRVIVMTGIEGEAYEVCAADGRIVSAGRGTARTTVAVQPGIYVVKAGERTAKVVVR